MKYYINYHTGAGNFSFEGSLEEAKEEARKGIAYTQAEVTIEDEETGEIISESRWYGVEPSEDDEILEQYDKFGFYENWRDRE